MMLQNALKNLMERHRLELSRLADGPGDTPRGHLVRYVSEEQSSQYLQRFGGLAANDHLVYQKIEEAGTKGLFARDLKSRTGITNPNVIRTIIEKLMKRKLIKDFTSVRPICTTTALAANTPADS
jgi:hypothetical protein